MGNCMSEIPEAFSSSFFSVSMSGGKDSTALALLAREMNLPHVRVFADTGWEAPETYEYLDYLELELGEIIRVRGKETLPERTMRSGTWPARVRRWCTKELKVYPIRDWMRGFLDSGLPEGFRDIVNVVGVRAEESATRAAFSAVEWNADTDCWIWRPLLRWSLADVLEIHKRHGIKVNPLYQRGFERVGCFPCIFAGKREIRRIAEQAPGRIDEIRHIEAATGNTMFAPRRPGSSVHVPTPIDDVVEWAKTKHGGIQFQLVAPPSGCARWGLCESQAEEDEDAM